MEKTFTCMRCGSGQWTWVSYSGCSNCVTPVSEEVLEHIRLHDYDGQGKSQAQEAQDSMWIVGAAVLMFVVLVVTVGFTIALSH